MPSPNPKKDAKFVGVMVPNVLLKKLDSYKVDNYRPSLSAVIIEAIVAFVEDK